MLARWWQDYSQALVESFFAQEDFQDFLRVRDLCGSTMMLMPYDKAMY
jgi:hypothetical protein